MRIFLTRGLSLSNIFMSNGKKMTLFAPVKNVLQYVKLKESI